jgi:hypothetical protein
MRQPILGITLGLLTIALNGCVASMYDEAVAGGGASVAIGAAGGGGGSTISPAAIAVAGSQTQANFDRYAAEREAANARWAAGLNNPGAGRSSGETVPQLEAPTTPTLPAEFEAKDMYPGNFGNIPGLQEVHAVAGRQRCNDLLKKLRREGNTFHGAFWYPTPMPGRRDFGHCKLVGPSARDDRFADTRYERNP